MIFCFATFRFLRFRKVGGLQDIVIRPKRSPIYFTVVKSKGDDANYSRVLGIMRVRGRGYLLLRWFTPTFPGSTDPVPVTHVCRQRYERVKLTNNVVVEQLDHIERTVAIAPHWTIPGLWYINHTPLGTTLQNTAWDTAMTLNEDESKEDAVVAGLSPYVRLAAAIHKLA